MEQRQDRDARGVGAEDPRAETDCGEAGTLEQAQLERVPAAFRADRDERPLRRELGVPDGARDAGVS